MKFGGIVGTVVLKGNLTPLIPYLKLAEEINVGLETVFGLGRIRISEESFSLQPAETA
jgi:CRISPR/Cas system endoribonuclease Cas6 (RAMP superfamily)